MKSMRRKEKAMKQDEAVQLLTDGEYGVLSTCGNDGEPYGIPLNYVYRKQCIYFHCALTGHKIENITGNPKVSFCVVGKTRVLPSRFSTEYESVIVTGTASVIEGQERYEALLGLLEKYSPTFFEEGKKYIERHELVTKVIGIQIEHISGKQSPPDQQ